MRQSNKEVHNRIIINNSNMMLETLQNTLNTHTNHIKDIQIHTTHTWILGTTASARAATLGTSTATQPLAVAAAVRTAAELETEGALGLERALACINVWCVGVKCSVEVSMVSSRLYWWNEYNDSEQGKNGSQA